MDQVKISKGMQTCLCWTYPKIGEIPQHKHLLPLLAVVVRTSEPNRFCVCVAKEKQMGGRGRKHVHGLQFRQPCGSLCQKELEQSFFFFLSG